VQKLNQLKQTAERLFVGTSSSVGKKPERNYESKIWATQLGLGGGGRNTGHEKRWDLRAKPQTAEGREVSGGYRGLGEGSR